MAGINKGRAVHGGNTFFIQQGRDEIFVIVDFGALGRGFAQAAMDGGEHVKSAFRLMAGNAFRRVQHVHHQVAAVLVDLHHFNQRVFRPFQRRQGGRLRDGGGIGSGLALQLVHGVDKLHRRAAEADAPAGHGIGLGAAIHGDGARPQTRLHLHDGGGLEAVIGQLVVNIVGEHPDIGVLQQHVANGAQLLGRISGAGGVAGGVEEEPFGFGRDGGLQILGAQLEPVILAAGHEYGRALGQRHDIRVAHPARGGDNHLVARLHGGQHGVENNLLAAGGNDNFFRLVIDAGVAQEFGGNGLAQRRGAGNIGVFGIAGLNRLDGRLLDVLRRVEIRLSGGQANNVTPRGF